MKHKFSFEMYIGRRWVPSLRCHTSGTVTSIKPLDLKTETDKCQPKTYCLSPTQG